MEHEVHLVEPTACWLSVVVQKGKIVTPREGCAVVAGADEASVLDLAHDSDALHDLLKAYSLIGRGVIHDDDLECRAVPRCQQRSQAPVGDRERVVDRDHDRHGRMVVPGKREWSWESHLTTEA